MNNTIKNKIVITSILAILVSVATAQNNWVLITNHDGIKVYTSTQTNSKIKAVKVECKMEATLTQLAVVIFDINTSTQWVYRTKNCVVLKEISPEEIFYYAEVDTPWPISNRDFIAHLKLSQNPITKVLVIEAENAPYFLPQKNNIVRIMRSVGKWVVAPAGKDSINVEYTLYTDPGGNVPAWLINIFITKGPLESFQKLRKHIKKPVYANAQLPGIKKYFKQINIFKL